jgi:SAM-dependent methyltransferase
MKPLRMTCVGTHDDRSVACPYKVRMDPTARFTGRADAYAAHRPAYGDDVARFVLEGLGPHPRVADLGAGTGISSRLLAAHGAHVLAIEPNQAMREKAASSPGVTYVDGTGAKTTLGDASVDAVVAFQAFHWFANDDALREIRRIVRPGGTASLVLNERDERDPFTAAYGAIIRAYAEDVTEQRRMDSMVVFQRLPGVIVRRDFANSQTLDRDGLQGRTRSTSYVPHDGPRADAMHGEVGALFDRSESGGHVRIALVTLAVRVSLA